jgi:hypothetical protein
MRLAVGALAAVGLLGAFLLAVGESVDARGPAALVLAAWWLLPFAIYALGVRTWLWSWLGGGLLMIGAAASLASIFQSDSSTAGMGFLTVPVLLGSVAVVIWLVDRRTYRTNP